MDDMPAPAITLAALKKLDPCEERFRALCECGCGKPAPLAKRNNERLGHIKGKPLRFLPGHNRRNTANLNRFTLVAGPMDTPCWEWTGPVSRKGYGACQVNGVKKNAHRALYEAALGPVSRGLHLDHLCANKLCVNPGHMEPVSPKENERRKRQRLAQEAA